MIGGPLQIVLTTALAAVAGVKAIGMPVTEAIWFGAMISLSSTVVVLKSHFRAFAFRLKYDQLSRVFRGVHFGVGQQEL